MHDVHTVTIDLERTEVATQPSHVSVGRHLLQRHLIGVALDHTVTVPVPPGVCAEPQPIRQLVVVWESLILVVC